VPYLDGADVVDDGDLVDNVDLNAGADVTVICIPTNAIYWFLGALRKVRLPSGGRSSLFVFMGLSILATNVVPICFRVGDVKRFDLSDAWYVYFLLLLVILLLNNCGRFSGSYAKWLTKANGWSTRLRLIKAESVLVYGATVKLCTKDVLCFLFYTASSRHTCILHI
jgi:hypothetical protein